MTSVVEENRTCWPAADLLGIYLHAGVKKLLWISTISRATETKDCRLLTKHRCVRKDLAQQWREGALVRKSIAYPYMDFRKSTVIHLDTHEFWMSLYDFPYYKCEYPQWYPSKDIHARTFYNGRPWNMNIHERTNVFYEYQSSIIHIFINIHLDIHWVIWISMYGLALDSQS